MQDDECLPACAQTVQDRNGHVGSGAVAFVRGRIVSCAGDALVQASVDVHRQDPCLRLALQELLDHPHGRIQRLEDEEVLVHNLVEHELVPHGKLVRSACAPRVPLPLRPLAGVSRTGSLRDDQREVLLRHDEGGLRDLAAECWVELGDGL